MNDEYYYLETLYHTFGSGGRVSGLLGVFLTIILVMSFSLISVWNPSISIILTIASLLFASYLGILTIGTSAIMGLVAVGFIIVLRNRS